MSELTGKNVLITGALGTIGQALVARYAEEGANVIALDRPDAQDPQKVLDGIAEGVRYVGCDLNDLVDLESKATTLQPMTTEAMRRSRRPKAVTASPALRSSSPCRSTSRSET